MARWGSFFFDSGVRWGGADSRGHTLRDPHIWLENPFDDPDISMDELLAFTTDHLERMRANNPNGELTARITATESALGLVLQRYQDDDTKLALRKARKMVKDRFRAELPPKVGKLAVKVENQYGEGSPEFVECFPHGRSIFSNCTDDKLESHIQTLITGLTAHQADLGAQAVTDATALKTGWLAVYAPSEVATAEKQASEDEKKYARENLQLMLYLNLIAICGMHYRQPEMLDTYMQISLIGYSKKKKKPEEPPTPPAPTP